MQQQNNWSEIVASYFAPAGFLSQAITGFAVRDQQIQMATAVARIIEEGGALAVEAGTGVGKTFAYLLPALLSGKKCLISTATKNLQDQLFNRDLPRLTQALGVPLQTALLKGRSSYLCQYRLELAQSQALPAFQRVNVDRIARWAANTQSGDLAEMSGIDEGGSWVALVTSTRDNCLGSECPQSKTCHVNQARRAAQQADLVVINHHLYFADLKIKDNALGQLLPEADVIVFDEAHQLAETGVQFLGDQLTSGQLLELARDALMTGLQWARGLAPWQDMSSQLDRAVRDWRMACSPNTNSVRLSWRQAVPQGIAELAWQDAVEAVERGVEQIEEALRTCEELAPDFAKLLQRTEHIKALLHLFGKPCEPSHVRWLELSKGFRLTQTPLEIGKWMNEHVWTQASERNKALIFTSATLAESVDLRWFTETMGLQQAQTLQLGSPYDHASQASIYVPRPFPVAGSREHSIAVADLTAEIAQQLGGRTMVLTTTLRALREIGERLKDSLPMGFEVLVQGQASRQELVERFRQEHQQDSPQRISRVLVGSASFWEGIDIPGQALMAVVIDKLPFPVPSDPWVQARSEQLQAEGKSAFGSYSLPAATVALKQGAGRLIRSENDCGVLLVCDSRLVSASYGRRMLASLPPMKLLGSRGEFEENLELLSQVTQQLRRTLQ